MKTSNEDAPRPGVRQTLSFLTRLCADHGIQPKKKLGQNFLIDLNVLELLAEAAMLSSNDIVIEVGSGTGSLTTRLAQQAGKVLSVEIDPEFHVIADEAVSDYDNVQLLNLDILKNKNELNPGVISALEEMCASSGDGNLKLVANLPYVVATPVIANFLLTGLPIKQMVVTVQWEIAERLLAKRGAKSYGALAVLVQSLAHVSLVRKLPPSVFWPRPQIHSAIVKISPDANMRKRVGDVRVFRNFLRDIYTHRRKNLRGAISGRPTGRISKKEVDAILTEIGIDGTLRSEDLTIAEHLVLCNAFAASDRARQT